MWFDIVFLVLAHSKKWAHLEHDFSSCIFLFLCIAVFFCTSLFFCIFLFHSLAHPLSLYSSLSLFLSHWAKGKGAASINSETDRQKQMLICTYTHMHMRTVTLHKAQDEVTLKHETWSCSLTINMHLWVFLWSNQRKKTRKNNTEAVYLSFSPSLSLFLSMYTQVSVHQQ